MASRSGTVDQWPELESCDFIFSSMTLKAFFLVTENVCVFHVHSTCQCISG